MPSRCRMPSEYLPAFRPDAGRRPDLLEHLVDAALRDPRGPRKTRRWFRPLRSGLKLCVPSTALTVRVGSGRSA
jgi:hypothetical protein